MWASFAPNSMIKIDFLQGRGIRKRLHVGVWYAAGAALVIFVALVAGALWFSKREEAEPMPESLLPLEVVEVPAEKPEEVPTPTPPAAPVERQAAYLEVLEEVEASIPPSVWLTSISSSFLGEYFIQGIAFSNTRAREFFRNLRHVSSIREIETPLFRKGRFDDVRTFQFTIRGVVDRAVPEGASASDLSRDPTALIVSIRKEGESIGLKFLGFSPPVDSLKAHPSRAEKLWASGRYSQMRQFLDYLSGLQDAAGVLHLIMAPLSLNQNNWDEVMLFLELEFYTKTDLGRAARSLPEVPFLSSQFRPEGD